MHAEKRAILVALPKLFAGINMLGGLTIKAANSWPGYKRANVMTHAIEALYKTITSQQAEGIRNSTAVLEKQHSMNYRH